MNYQSHYRIHAALLSCLRLTKAASATTTLACLALTGSLLGCGGGSSSTSLEAQTSANSATAEALTPSNDKRRRPNTATTANNASNPFDVISNGRTLYVSPSGKNTNDNGTGFSEAAPYQTIQYAMDNTQPGDTVLVMNGTYSLRECPGCDIVTISKSGRADAWISLKAFPGQTPFIKSANWAAIKVQANYILVEGMTVEGNRDEVSYDTAYAERNNKSNPITSGNGVGVAPPYNQPDVHPHHVVLRGNKVSNCSGGGIFTAQSDYVLIENNAVWGNAFWSPYGNSGISMYQGWNSDDSTDYKMIVRGNASFNNFNKIPFVDSNPRAITDGNGIIIDDNRNTQNFSGNNNNPTPYKGRTLVDSNLVFENGARGINVYSSDHVDVVHNTSYRNSIQPETPDGEVTMFDAKDVRVFNNILVAREDRPVIKRASANDPSKADERNSQSFGRNIVFSGTGFDAPTNDNKLGVDPQFLNPSAQDFRVANSSPAIDAADTQLSFSRAIFGSARPLGNGPDIGAYEIR
jgi:Periplasmic copper-binding protein (NosD)